MTVVNRCGVIAGPWQMGKVDQGVLAYWMLAHHFGRPLAYIGFGGSGKQVRDLLHVDDLLDLIDLQLSDPGSWTGVVVNVGGGQSALSRSSSSPRSAPTSRATRSGSRRLRETGPGTSRGTSPTRRGSTISTAWRPSSSVGAILSDVHEWIIDNEHELGAALAID